MEGGARVVVDASVAVKWFVEEEYTREAVLLLSAYRDALVDLAAPSLLPYEVLNTLKYSAALGEDELKEIMKALEDLQITLHPLEGAYASRAIEVAMRKGITVYDASYVALAEILQATLYTADERLIRKTRGLGYVRHIGDFTLP